MSKYYENYRESYDELEKFLKIKVAQAEVRSDKADARKWQRQLDEFTSWKNNGDGGLGPITADVWIQAGLELPGEGELVPPEESEEESQFDILVSKIETLLKDSNPDQQLLSRFAELTNLLDDHGDEDGWEQKQRKYSRIKGQVLAKQLIKARSLLEMAGETENLNEKQQLLSELERWNPEDREVSKQMAELQKELTEGTTQEDVRIHLTNLSSKKREDLPGFGISLRNLESALGSHPEYFNQDDEQTIKKAREYFDAEISKGGMRTSMQSTEDLLLTYIVYREYQAEINQQVNHQGQWTDRAAAEADVYTKYKSASARRLQKLVANAQNLSFAGEKPSPTAAINYLDGPINHLIEREIAGKIETIYELPLTEEDRGKLIDFRDKLIQVYKPKEDAALAELKAAENADGIYARVTHLIKSYQTFKLPEIKTQIVSNAQYASETRVSLIKLEFEQLSDYLERLKNTQLDFSSDAIEKINEKLKAFDALVSEEWFGVPNYDENVTREPLAELELPPKPTEIRTFAVGGDQRNDYGRKLENVKADLDTIKSTTGKIDQFLNDVKPPNVRAAINEFNAIKENQNYVSYRSFKDLEKLIAKHQGLVEHRDRMQQLLETNHYSELVDYFYANVVETKAFTDASIEERAILNELFNKAESEEHNNLMILNFNRGNFKAAQDEMIWLQNRGMISEGNQETAEKLKIIIDESNELERLYINAFNALDINQDSIIPSIFSLFPSFLTKFRNRKLEPSVQRELQEVLDESETEIDSIKLQTHLEKMLSKKNFDLAFNFIHTILYLAKEEVKSAPDQLGSVANSTIEYDARRFAPILKSLLKNRILKDLKTNSGYDIFKVVIEAYTKIPIQGDVAFVEEIETIVIEKAYGQQQKNSQSGIGQEGLQKNLELWSMLSEAFPKSSQLLNEKKNTQKKYFEYELNRYLRNHRWNEANDLISEIRKNVKNLELLSLQFKFYTDIENREYFSTDKAREIHNTITESFSEAREIETQESELIIAEKFELAEQDLLRTIQLLNVAEYQDNPVIIDRCKRFGDIIERERTRELYILKNQQDYPGMIKSISEIFMIDQTIGKDVDPNIQALIYDLSFKSQVPEITLDLAREGRNLLEDTNLTIQASLSEHENLIPRISGLRNILIDGYKVQANGKNIYEQVIGSFKSGYPTLIEFQALNNKLISSRETLRKAEELKSQLKNPERWGNVIKDEISGNINSWADLKRHFSGFDGVEDYIDIRNLIDGFESWKEMVETVNRLYGEFQDYNDQDGTQKCGELIGGIGTAIQNAPIIYDQEFTKSLKSVVNDCLKIREFGTTNIYTGTAEIAKYNTEKAQQIQKLADLLQKQETKEREANELIKDLIAKKHQWDLLYESKEKVAQDYLQMFNEFFQSGYNEVVGTNDILDLDFTFVTSPIQEEETENDSEHSIFKSIKEFFIRPRRDTPRQQGENKLMRDLKKDYRSITLEDQSKKMSELIKIYGDIQEKISEAEKAVISQKAEDIFKVIKDNEKAALEQVKRIEPIIQYAKEIVEEKQKTLKGIEEIDRMWTHNQTINIAQYLISINPYLIFDEYLLNQKNLVIRRLTQERQ